MNTKIPPEGGMRILYSVLKEMSYLDWSAEQVSNQDTDQDKPVNRLIAVLGNEEMSAADIMNQLGMSHLPTFRKNYLSPALESGLVEKTIPDKPNSKNQKYRRVK